MKLTVVIPVMNQHDLFKAVLHEMIQETSESTEILVIDNGSDKPLDLDNLWGNRVRVIRNEKSTGVYPTFKQGMEEAKGDVVAFLHSDLVVWEFDWDLRVLDVFEKHEKLGLLGFIGSNEIDGNGGRGRGTTSNFQGMELKYGGKKWVGSPASAHGMTNNKFSAGAVVDGCAMIIRKDAWFDIGYRPDFPIHHFYDRLISCQMREGGWEIGVLGIACDHFSGQTVNQEPNYFKIAEEWCQLNGIPFDGKNWDSTVYHEAERRFLAEYRDKKRLLPAIV